MNKANGFGKFYHVDGDIYEGEWSEDKANGHGVYYHVNGARYEGMWKDDLQNGIGKEVCIIFTILLIGRDNSKYEGEYLNGLKHGFGRYEWPDGSIYSGEWYENKL